MVRRARGSEFMGNAFVFPGGSIDPVDSSELAGRAIRWGGDPVELPWRAAALRELWEEAGLALTNPEGITVAGDGAAVYESVLEAGGRLDAGRLHCLSRWITPEGLPRRFDTRFYTAEVTSEAAAAADGVEVFDDTWVMPADALEHQADGSWDVPFPTVRHLELLAGYGSIGEVIEYAEGLTEIPGVLPTIVMGENGEYEVRIPGDPGYDTKAET